MLQSLRSQYLKKKTAAVNMQLFFFEFNYCYLYKISLHFKYLFLGKLLI